MAAIIVRIVGILITSIGGFTMIHVWMSPRNVEAFLLAALILLVGIVMILLSFLAPRWHEKTYCIENCLGYPLHVDASGEPTITCARDTVEAKLYLGVITFDEYVELVAPCEFDLHGNDQRTALARAHKDTTLLSSEYADELAALAVKISALRDSFAAGEITDKEYCQRMDQLRPPHRA